MEISDAMVEAFRAWYLEHVGRRITRSNSRKAMSIVLASREAVPVVKQDSDAVQRVRDHVEKNANRERAQFSIAGLRAVLAEIDAAPNHKQEDGNT